MQPPRPHVIDPRADAGRAAGCGRSDKPADRVEIAGTGEIKRPSRCDKLEIGGVSPVMTVRAGSLAARSRLAAGSDADDVDARFVRRREQHAPQRGVDRHVPDLGAAQRRFVDRRHFGGPEARLPRPEPSQPGARLAAHVGGRCSAVRGSALDRTVDAKHVEASAW